MKKYSVLFAALAVIALAGCKKEESRNMNGIVIGGETYQNADKQAYSPDFQYVMFDGTDNILFNGVAYSYTMIDNPTDRNTVTDYSNYAVLNVPAEAIVDDVTILYPDVTSLSIDAIGMTMVDETPNAGLPNQIVNCVWPMGYHSNNFHSHGQIQLKNAVAIISPAVKYGLPCFQNIVTNNRTYFPNETASDFATVLDLPQLIVTSVELISSTKITGDAHIEFDELQTPAMVMDDPMDGATDVLSILAPGTGIDIPAAGNNFKIVGNIPITPNMTGADFQMKVYFDFVFADRTLHCVYNSDTRTLAAGEVMRNHRTTCIANMFTAGNYTKVQIVGED